MSDLSRLLNPRTIAVIGGREAARVVEQCDKFSFAGEIWPVHPTREEVHGRVCFRSIDELPAAPDVAYVAVNRELTIDMVQALTSRGAGGAVCYAAGFAEADSESVGSGELQKRLVEAAGDMPIIGPNCYGFINGFEGAALWPDQHGATRCESGVAILTQSSNIAINMTMQKRGLPIAMVMTAGNQAQIGLSALGEAMLEDERVTALGLHIEGLDDVTAFEHLAMRARELRKPIVAIKVGKSEQAQAATLTHTASLAGSDVAHNALFQRLGIARVFSIEAFLETLKLFHAVGPLPGSDLLSLSCSGGEASLMADAAEGRSVSYRPFKEREAKALKAQLGDIVTIANPLDYNTFIWGDWPGMIRMFEAALEPQFDLSLLVIDFPLGDRCDDADWRNATNAFVAAVKQVEARSAVVASLPECMPEDVATDLMSKRIAPLCGIAHALDAVEAAAFVGKAWSVSAPAPLVVPSGSKDRRLAQDLEVLDEREAKQALAAMGLIVPKGGVVVSAPPADFEQITIVEGDLPDLSHRFDFEEPPGPIAPPFALKALGVAHKSDVGGVLTNLHRPSEIVSAMSKMSHLANRFLLEEMAAKPIAELIVGVTRDPVVGLMLTIGAGGVLTELLEDAATLLLPVSEADVRTSLAGLKIGKLLDGYRDTEAADIDALIANIVCIANYATANADTLEELDVNPLFATQFGSVAVDALIVKRKDR